VAPLVVLHGAAQAQELWWGRGRGGGGEAVVASGGGGAGAGEEGAPMLRCVDRGRGWGRLGYGGAVGGVFVWFWVGI
jgi:hypothetical protein